MLSYLSNRKKTTSMLFRAFKTKRSSLYDLNALLMFIFSLASVDISLCFWGLWAVCCRVCVVEDAGLLFMDSISENEKLNEKKLVKNSKKNNSQITIYFWHQIVGRMQGEPEVSAGEASSRLLISKHFKHLKSFAYYINTQWLFDFHHIQLDVNLLWPTLIMFKIAVLQKGDDSNENKTMLMFLNVSFIHG